jgi:hypothetical protein
MASRLMVISGNETIEKLDPSSMELLTFQGGRKGLDERRWQLELMVISSP